MNENDTEAKQPLVVAFQHRTIARFAIRGTLRQNYEFKDFVLRLIGKDDEETLAMRDDFLASMDNAELRDRNNVVELKEADNMLSLEQAKSRRITGAVTSDDIKAPITSQNIGSGGAPIKVV
jgi:hypothetical protein